MEQETNTVCTEDVLPCMVLNTVRIFQLIILFIKNVDSGIFQKYLYVDLVSRNSSALLVVLLLFYSWE